MFGKHIPHPDKIKLRTAITELTISSTLRFQHLTGFLRMFYKNGNTIRDLKLFGIYVSGKMADRVLAKMRLSTLVLSKRHELMWQNFQAFPHQWHSIFESKWRKKN